MIQKKKEIKEKKIKKDIKNLRKFILVHSQGHEEIEANSPFEAKMQGKERMLQKGMKYPQDRKDFYEVKI